MSSLLLEPLLPLLLLPESRVSSLLLEPLLPLLPLRTGVGGVFFAAGTAASSVTTTGVDNAGVDGVFFDAGCCCCCCRK